MPAVGSIACGGFAFAFTMQASVAAFGVVCGLGGYWLVRLIGQIPKDPNPPGPSIGTGLPPS
jgi:hypothetical protein